MRERYRPDLLLFDLTNKMTVKSRIMDKSWALSKAALKAQSKSFITAVTEWDIHGLTDNDSFSDYVNVILLFQF